MVLTSFPTDQGKGAVRIRITADTVCQGQDVFKGEELVVPYGEYINLKHSNKAEIVAESAPAEVAVSKPAPVGELQALKLATIEELITEVKAAGYADEAAKSIAQDRFDGKYGEANRYLKKTAPWEVVEAEIRAQLEPKVKAEIVAAAQQNGLELNENKTKVELVQAFVDAAKSEYEKGE